MTTTPESKIKKNCDIFDWVIKMSDIAYRGLSWHGKMESESENIIENLRGNNIFTNAERESNLKLKSRAQNFVNWNHTGSILNWNQKDSESIHVDPNATDLSQLNP